MANSRTIVNVGYFLLVLLILAGIGVGLYYLIIYYTTPAVNIKNVTLEKLGGNLAGGLLKFDIQTMGCGTSNRCNYTPKLVQFLYNKDGFTPTNIYPLPEFQSITSTGIGSWNTITMIPDDYVFDNGSMNIEITVGGGPTTGLFSGKVTPTVPAAHKSS